MLNKAILINEILNSPSYNAKPIKFGLGYPETGHFINDVEQLGFDLHLTEPCIKSIIISSDCVNAAIARAITSHAVKDVYTLRNKPSDKSFIILTSTDERIHVYSIAGSLTECFMPLPNLAYGKCSNLGIFKPAIRLVALSHAVASNLDISKMLAFQLCHAIQGIDGKEKIISETTSMMDQYATKHELSVTHPHLIHYSLVMSLIKSAPVEEHIKHMQVDYMDQLIKQNYASLANPFNDLMSKLMK